ncbi:hypothetical protein PG999_008368 [Apiospora kogelbergensis]|uniref:Uncharacterized protein n=1 Tax=Apiospora kogelbergensis TaxID=1337665 RepID=A0AAW0QHR7_9PEZI
MVPETERDDISDTFSSTVDGDSILTPTTSDFGSGCDASQLPTIIGDDAWGGYCSSAIPWPGNTYIIINKDTRRPLYRHHDGGVYFGKPEETSTAAARFQWLCVENNNHIGFQNPQSGCYLGHSGKDYAVASACLMKEWEYIIARPHPKGGYQLLSQHWWHTLKLFTVDDEGNGLVRRMHGTTLFEFKKL